MPAWFVPLWMFPMILRNSIPALNVWAPRVHVSMSLMMKVGRVVTLPTLMPELLPSCAYPSPNESCGGTG